MKNTQQRQKYHTLHGRFEAGEQNGGRSLKTDLNRTF
jgi:hypothetical protein